MGAVNWEQAWEEMIAAREEATRKFRADCQAICDERDEKIAARAVIYAAEEYYEKIKGKPVDGEKPNE